MSASTQKADGFDIAAFGATLAEQLTAGRSAFAESEANQTERIQRDLRDFAERAPRRIHDAAAQGLPLVRLHDVPAYELEFPEKYDLVEPDDLPGFLSGVSAEIFRVVSQGLAVGKCEDACVVLRQVRMTNRYWICLKFGK